MIGLPNFNTREDVDNALDLYPHEARIKLKSLWEDRYTWVEVRELENKEDGLMDDTHIVSEKQEGGFVQLEKVVDKNAAIYRLGFTDEEVMVLIEEKAK